VSLRSRFTPAASRIRDWLAMLAPLADLYIRYVVASAFFKSGLTKTDSWDKTLFLFQAEYHVPLLPPAIAAALGTFGELFFPPLLLLGLAGRFAALSLTFVNIVAVISYWQVLGQNEAALAQHVYWGTLLLVTLTHGPGKLSLDHWIGRWAAARAAPASV
jgi:putative oxidoreductase